MKKMNKKGFTLIELLAIIVILAIIAVITVPIILNVIEEARDGARKNSVIGYAKAVELSYTQQQIGSTIESEDEIEISIDGASQSTLAVSYDGDDVVCSGDNTITKGKIVLRGCSVDGSTTTYTYESGDVEAE